MDYVEEFVELDFRYELDGGTLQDSVDLRPLPRKVLEDLEREKIFPQRTRSFDFGKNIRFKNGVEIFDIRWVMINGKKNLESIYLAYFSYRVDPKGTSTSKVWEAPEGPILDLKCYEVGEDGLRTVYRTAEKGINWACRVEERFRFFRINAEVFFETTSVRFGTIGGKAYKNCA